MNAALLLSTVLAQTGPGSAFSAGNPDVDQVPQSRPQSRQAAPSEPAPEAEPAADGEGEPEAEPTAEAEPSDTPELGPAPRAVDVDPRFANPTFAATDYRPRGPVEKDLCDRASTTDYAYIATTVGLAGGAIVFDATVGQSAEKPFWRTASTGLVGLTFGSVVGGFYLSLPKCSADFVPPVNPEGHTAVRWPVALGFAAAAGILAPFVVWIEQGFVAPEWSLSERGSRIYVPSIAGVAGALLPWIPQIAPKTYRNMLKLEKLRIEAAPVPPGASVAASGVFFRYSLAF